MEAEIEIVDKTLFFIRPYHVKDDDKQILSKEMKRQCHLGKLKEFFSAYSSTVMLISRKLTKGSRCVSDCRLINTRIAKTSLAFPLVGDIFLCWEVSNVRHHQ